MQAKDNLALIQVRMLESSILHLNLNRPSQLNALNHDLLATLGDVFLTAKEDKSVRAILLTGEGKGFCAGADIKELSNLNAEQGYAFAQFGQSIFNQLELMGKPSLAAIHGFAFGGGLELAMAATLRISTDNATFGQPEIQLGVMPGFGGTKRLTRLIGQGRALDLCLTGRRFSAKEALSAGLLTEFTEPENLISRAKQILMELTQFSPIALKHIMSTIYQSYHLPLMESLDLEATHFAICCSTADKNEGVAAFLEKRKAHFLGE